MLAIEGVSKRYGAIDALAGVSLTVAAGEVVALVGENGAGKTSLVRCVAGAMVPDAGRITIGDDELGRTPSQVVGQGVAVVWQDLALCDNLDVTANLFLGREPSLWGGLRQHSMRARARAALADLGLSLPGLDQPLDRLSGGQRQLVAIARATFDRPRVLVLDEPTTSLGVAESRRILGVIRRLRDQGVAVLLVSHQLDDVFDLADRIVVLRHGRAVADLHRSEAHPDDVVALITGSDVETTAGQQLRRLHSLAEQLAEAERSSVLPLTVSSLSAALRADRLAVLLVDRSGQEIVLHRSASLNLPPELEQHLSTVPGGALGGFLGEAAERAELQVVPNLGDRPDDPVARAAAGCRLSGAWAAPIVGQSATLAVVAGFSDGPAPLQADQIQLLELFSSVAGAAIERAELVESLRTRNRSLQGLHGILEALAGPDLLDEALPDALDTLCRGVGGSFAAVLVGPEPGLLRERASSHLLGGEASTAARTAVAAALGGADRSDVALTRFNWSQGSGAVACHWRRGDRPHEWDAAEAQQVLEGTARSVRLALERQQAAERERESLALQRSREIERGLTRRLGHELRTPLTAIRGFASTMLQTDVEWSDADKQRFLGVIESEAGRMGRLVAQLFDDNAIETGTLRLETGQCDLVAVVRRALSIVDAPRPIVTRLPRQLTIEGDCDRLQQLVVNLLDNAVRHNPDDATITITASPAPRQDRVLVAVSDDGVGLPDDVAAYLNGRIDELEPGRGMGVRLARGFTRAHGGSIVARSSGAGSTIEVELPLEGESQS